MASHLTDRVGDTTPDIELRDEDRFDSGFHEPESARSNFTAFLMGGVVVSGGLLAFLYYDTDNLNGRGNSDLLTTGSLGRIEAPAVPTLLAPNSADIRQQR
jgi:hypothetical protein